MLKRITSQIAVVMACLMIVQENVNSCSLDCVSYTQVSLGLECSALITPDILLAGNNADCAGPFSVQLMDENMNNLTSSPYVGSEHANTIVMASVTDLNSGAQCMVTLFIADKITNDLICGTTAIDCDEYRDLDIPIQLLSNISKTADGNCQSFLFPNNTAITDLNFSANFSTTTLDGVNINISTQSGEQVTILEGTDIASCTDSDFEIIFDEQSVQSYSNLTASCGSNSDTDGVFQAKGALADLYVNNPNTGNITVEICADAGSAFTLNNISLHLATEGKITPLPIPAGTKYSESEDGFVVTNFDGCGAVDLTFQDQDENESCDSPYQETITRTWLVTDQNGNTDECVQTIHINRVSPNDVVMPPNYISGDAGFLACEDREVDPGNQIIPNVGWNALPDGSPSPYHEYYPAPNDHIIKWYGTGTPELGGCSNLSQLYDDLRINVCDSGDSNGCFTIKRTWLVFEHCTGVMSMHIQTIKVMDNEAPSISGLSDFSIAIVDNNSCLANTNAPVPVLTDNCSDATDLSYTIESNNGTVSFIPLTGTYFLENLPLGETILTYLVSDCCGNESIETITVTVEDETPPTTVCKDASVNLTIDGCGKLFPESIDDGSNDNCSDTVFLRIIRMDDLLGTAHGSFASQATGSADASNGDDDIIAGNQIYFDTVAFFCCEDIPSVQVVLRTFDIDPGPGPVHPDRMQVGGDLFGHYTECMRTVFVNDKLPPIIACPSDITLECKSDLTNLTITGEATAVDNCEMLTPEYSDEEMLNVCGVGTVVRTWSVTDASGIIVSCDQTITLEDNTTPVVTFPEDITISCEFLDDLEFTGEPSYEDNCDLIAFSFEDDTVVPFPSMFPCGFTFVRRWTGLSLCDGDAIIDFEGTQTITAIDNTAPTFNETVMDLTLTCASEVPSAVLTGSDNCTDITADDIFFDQVTIDSICPNGFVWERFWLITDSCGNNNTASQAITVSDNIRPVLSVSDEDFTIACGAEVPDAPLVTATDNCGDIDPMDIVVTDTPGDDMCMNGLVHTRTWSVMDACGNDTMVTHRFFQPDSDPPMFVNPPMDVTLNCLDMFPDSSITVTDDCTATDLLIVTVNDVDDVDPNCPFNRVLTRTWLATDLCQRTNQHVQVITTTDTETPTFDYVPPSGSFLCSANDIPDVNELAQASDNCGLDSIAMSIDSAQVGCVLTITRTYVAVDLCGLSNSAQSILTITDDEAPELVGVPNDITLTCTDPVPAVANVTATDNCSNNLMVNFEQDSIGTCINNFVIERIWSVQDDCGQEMRDTQYITKVDVTPPNFSFVPDDETYACNIDFFIPEPIVDDSDCDLPQVVETRDTVFQGCTEIITRTWTATDLCGLSATADQVITRMDESAPTTEDLPENITVSCGNVPVEPTLEFVDDCGTSADVTVEYRADTIPGSCIHEFVIIRNYFPEDACDNRDSVAYSITVEDKAVPTFVNFPGNLSLNCFEDTTPMVGTQFQGPSATDDCGNATVTYSDAMEMGTCQTITRTWIATDECGKTNTQNQIITFSDDEAPTFNPATVPSFNLLCNDPFELPMVTAEDNCGALDTFYMKSDTIVVNTNGTCNEVRNVWVAVDRCGNTDSLIQEITVFDNIRPAVSFLDPNEDDVLFADCEMDIPAIPQLVVNDNCTLTDTIITNQNEICTPPNLLCPSKNSSYSYAYDETILDANAGIMCPSLFAIRRLWVVHDGCGTTETMTQVVLVQDNTPPVFTPTSETIVVDCGTDIDTMFFGPPGVSDSCSEAMLAFSDVSTPGNCADEMTTTRTWVATDSCGNSSTAVQIFNFIDTIAPMIVCPNDATFAIGGEFFEPHICDVDVNLVPLLLNDACDDNVDLGNSINANIGQTEFNFEIGVHTLTYTAMDNCGNSNTCDVQITVEDNRPPSVSLGLPGCIVLDNSGEFVLEIDSVFMAFDCDTSLEAVFVDTLTNAVIGPSLLITTADLPTISIKISVKDNFNNGVLLQNLPGEEVEIFLIEQASLCLDGGSPPLTAGGTIKTSIQEEVSDIPVYLESMDEMVYTDEEGNYFTTDQNVGPGFSLEPLYNDRIRAGLTTLDLVMISRHLVGLQEITDPYLLIAADTDYSGEVNAFDLITLQKVILYIEDQFPNGNAWRFLDENHLFPLSGNPFESPFPEEIVIEETTIDYMNLNFVAVKLGDVNNSFSNNSESAENRNQLPNMEMFMEDKLMNEAETISIPVYAGNNYFAHGFEMGIELLSGLQWKGYDSGLIDPTVVKKGNELLIQWVEPGGERLENNQPLFFLNFAAAKAARLDDLINISSNYLSNTAYANNKASHKIALNIQGAKDHDAVYNSYHPMFFPNVPNPFRQETTIRFYVPESGEAILQISDLDGRVIYRSKADFQKGYHEQVLRSSDLPSAGVLQCQLITEQGTAEQQILLIRD